MTPLTVTCPAPLSIRFPRQDWSGLPFPSPGDLPHPGREPLSPTQAGWFFTTELPGKLFIKFWFYILVAQYSLQGALTYDNSCRGLGDNLQRCNYLVELGLNSQHFRCLYNQSRIKQDFLSLQISSRKHKFAGLLHTHKKKVENMKFCFLHFPMNMLVIWEWMIKQCE